MILRSRLRGWLIALALSLAVVGVAPMVSAQEYDEQTIAEVNDHFKKGAQLYYDGDYDAAITQFEAAHAKIPNAIFLYNISLAQAKKGDHHESLKTAERAEEFGGLGPDEQVQNRARIAALRRVVVSEQTSADIAAQPVVEPVFDFGLLSWIGSALVVGGVLGYGGVLLIDSNLKPDVDDYKRAVARGDDAEAAELRDEIRPRQTGGRVLFAVSSVAIAAGAGLLVYDLVFRKDEPSVAVGPIPGGIGVSFQRRF